MGLMTKLFGTYSTRELKSIYPIVDRIEALSDEYAAMTDAQLQAKTPEFKERLQQGETLDDILPEAFATVREAAWRVLGLRPYRVQLVGGIVLHQGRIAEMKTGEGKTLVATLPAYLNALTGEGVHIVTVNDYLAKRDSEWMGKVHRFLGLTVGLIIHDITKEERKAAYAADITYGTNNEMGFDYLRDNMALYASELVQRGHNFAIVDEVDSILIDEARTPLIISGMGDKSTQLYDLAETFAARLRKHVVAETDDKAEEDVNIDADYVVDEKGRTVTLTARGVAKAEEFFHLENLSDPENSTIAHHINQAIRAHGIMKRDVDYVVKDGEVVIVDEFTGRLMFGRRYSEGLHQAIEAKEHVSVQRESKTLATITFQNYFRLYQKLSGMTGTALTEEEEFATIYKLDIIEIPTNKPIARVDNEDAVYKTQAGKYRAVIEQIKECHAKGQPVLVGTVSIEKNELLGKLLSREKIPHNLLNAKNHEKEAEIVAQAGKLGAVTIATNMAGRGTDIMLGGNAEYLAKNDLRKAGLTDELIAEATGYAETDNQEILDARALFARKLQEHKDEIADEARQVREAGGLFIIGTERHDSRRIDNQLRGRAGRQGDPGETRLKTSPERLNDILGRLKQFEPSGIFAENLAECLKIQLADGGNLTPELDTLLDNLPLLAERKFKELSTLCGCTPAQIIAAAALIKTLNPKPAAAFADNRATYIIPDVFVKRNRRGEYRVELNDMTLPRLLINRGYYAELRKDKSAARYLKENLSHANFLIKALHQRATTILRVAEEIVLRQYHFFEKGIEHLRPMTLKDVAGALSLSESTVSRVTTGKYLEAPNGMFELKYFFSAAAGSYIGDDTSTTVIRHKIKTLIDNEDPHHILSDDKIVELLEQDGVKIARRTVTKYREALGIPTSGQRKRAKRT